MPTYSKTAGLAGGVMILAVFAGNRRAAFVQQSAETAAAEPHVWAARREFREVRSAQRPNFDLVSLV